MKKITLCILTFLFGASSVLAQEYVHTHTLTKHRFDVFSIAFMDNDTLLSGSGDNTIRAWNVSTGGQQQWDKDVTYAVFAVAVPSPEPTFFAYGGAWDTTVRLRNIADRGGRARLRGHTATVRSLAFKPNSYHLASSSEDNAVRVWDVAAADNPKLLHTLTGHTIDVWAVTWSPDGKLLASGSDDTTIRLWSLQDEVSFKELKGHQEGVWSVAFSPDGQMLASGSEDNTVRIWDVTTGKIRHILKGHTGWVYSVAFHPDGQTLASGCYDKTIRLWNPHTGEHKTTLTGHTDRVSAVAFRPDGQMLVSASYDNTIRLWSYLTTDVTGDGKVDAEDIVEIGKNYGKTVADGANPRADVNQNGTVDMADLVAVANAVEQHRDGGQQPEINEEDIWE